MLLFHRLSVLQAGQVQNKYVESIQLWLADNKQVNEDMFTLQVVYEMRLEG